MGSVQQPPWRCGPCGPKDIKGTCQPMGASSSPRKGTLSPTQGLLLVGGQAVRPGGWWLPWVGPGCEDQPRLLGGQMALWTGACGEGRPQGAAGHELLVSVTTLPWASQPRRVCPGCRGNSPPAFCHAGTPGRVRNPALSRGPRGLFHLCGGSCRAASPAWGLPWGLCTAATSGPTTGFRLAASGLLPQGRAGPPRIGRCGWTVEPPFPSGGLCTSQPAGRCPGGSAQPLGAGHPQSRGPECQARVGG